ncbi:MAG: 50S ribosomal protein L17 [Leptospiraceae bacterium]|nr:50S ribosomal protein L17 [Leptospiraceae bacterium]MDW8306055.1 50S ribosomal protein L17 [Leptospiraceae bacterium]
MRKSNKVKQLQRESSHRRAMLANLVTSLFYHEQIKTTVAKAKAARRLAEKLITRARKNAVLELSPAEKIHNIRQARRVIKNREVLQKLFEDIGPRFAKYDKGGYTRVLKVGFRSSDASEMALLELVEKKELAQLKEERKAFRARLKGLARVKTKSRSKEKEKKSKEKKEKEKSAKK